MGWDGCDAAGEVLCEGDEVKVMNGHYESEGLPVGSVARVRRLEPLSYNGNANRQIYVHVASRYFWLNHKWVLTI